MVDLHIPLSEIEKWDLEDIAKANAVLDMRRDYDSALDAYQAEQYKERQ